MLDLSIVTACLVLGAEPALVAAVIDNESRWQASAFNVNGWSGERYASEDLAQAIAAAQVFVDNGYSVDIGVMQVNSNNLAAFGVSVPEAFDVCTNVKIGEAILLEGIDRALANGAQGDEAIRIGLSYYNTGHPRRGLANGYVDRVWSSYTDDNDMPSKLSTTDISWNSTSDLFDYSDHTAIDINHSADLSGDIVE